MLNTEGGPVNTCINTCIRGLSEYMCEYIVFTM